MLMPLHQALTYTTRARCRHVGRVFRVVVLRHRRSDRVVPPRADTARAFVRVAATYFPAPPCVPRSH